MIFQPITRQVFEGTLFNDIRLEKRYYSLQQSMITNKSSVINQVALNDAESKAYYRFLGNERVSASELLGGALGHSAGLSSVTDQHLLVAKSSQVQWELWQLWHPIRRIFFELRYFSVSIELIIWTCLITLVRYL